jgi:hypothetical protein
MNWADIQDDDIIDFGGRGTGRQNWADVQDDEGKRIGSGRQNCGNDVQDDEGKRIGSGRQNCGNDVQDDEGTKLILF